MGCGGVWKSVERGLSRLYLALVFEAVAGNMKNSLTMMSKAIILKILLVLFSLLLLQGCAATVVGAVVGTATTVAVEVVKVPFKVGAAVVDVVSDDEEDE